MRGLWNLCPLAYVCWDNPAALVLQNGNKSIKQAGKTRGGQWIYSCLKYPDSVINSGSKCPWTRCHAACCPGKVVQWGHLRAGWALAGLHGWSSSVQPSQLPGNVQLSRRENIPEWEFQVLPDWNKEYSQIAINGFHGFVQRGLWKYQAIEHIRSSLKELSFVLQ